MPHYICVTCGTQYPEGAQPPAHCPICEDPRQYVGWEGQRWTTLDALRRSHRAVFHAAEPGLLEIGMTPDFAIAQRALLIQTRGGNILWDCIPLLDEAIAQVVSVLGGLSAIAISHPHYYSSMVEWAAAFHAPIYL
ncbi:MAG: MBL fold metallo-hydrolase, partial [Anaerolineae bacterium]|nr:MBL fold metallo-hydrolase [Anaerolineae bacterium]